MKKPTIRDYNMKTRNLIKKSLKEQLRSFWVLLLTLSMGPFFIFVYYLIIESSKIQYNILIINTDSGIIEEGKRTNYGANFISYLTEAEDTFSTPFNTRVIAEKNKGIEQLENKKADALIIIPESFSKILTNKKINNSINAAPVEFIGDLTSTNYLLSAVWVNDMLSKFGYESLNKNPIIQVTETALGVSSSINAFDMIVPGILIVSIIMLMFTASIAFVSEVENKTIMRLKLSRLSAFEFLTGIGFVQLLVGFVSFLLTLLTAISLGFNYQGSLGTLIVITSLTSISIISVSLIIGAATKTSNEVLVVGNFPMFLFMFFTGAAFPLKADPLFSIAGYDISVQGLMSPTHAISALNKTLILNMDFQSVIPEMIAIIVLSVIYFVIGALIFKYRHLRLN